MEFRTAVECPQGTLSISHADQLLLLGSCFAESIGKRLISSKFDCDVNPFGILYNPLSIEKAVRRMLIGEPYVGNDLFLHQGQYHSYMHHSSFSSAVESSCLNTINDRLLTASQRLREVDYLLITFGTAHVYRLKASGQVVSNCHKMKGSLFDRNRLSVEEIVNCYDRLIRELLILNPRIKLLFTVSPIRHLKDGLHGNQLSKSTLLLAIDELQHHFPTQTFYFPSYELLMDELREYRFYADDMLHPSPLAVQYVWECFSTCYFDQFTQAILAEWNEISKALNHKPFHPESAQYKDFLIQLVLRIERLKEKCPYLDVQIETTKLCPTR